jgi:hypothetical protein
MVVLSDSISTSGSAILTGSPTRLNHRPTDEFAADIPIGTGILFPYLLSSGQSLFVASA